MNRLKVALLSGGTSSERDVSLKSGDGVFDALDKNRYQISRFDPKYDLGKLVADSEKIDIALIILHGPNGEDGTIQGLLDLLNVPYQGTGVLGSALAMNKTASKQLYKHAGLMVPHFTIINKNEAVNPKEIVGEIGLPAVIKPVKGGSSIGMSIVRDENDLLAAIQVAFQCDDTVLAEQYISGMEVTGAVLGNQEVIPLPLVEIIPNAAYDFFNYSAKYTPGATNEICPARLDERLTQRVQECARIAHKALFCDDYSRTDMIVDGEDIYVLETNTIPGMTPTSLLPLAAKTAGISFGQLLDRLIDLSLERSNRKR
ncbi:MAG: D-alanine--D-alanine ligase [Desulfobacteraceae bacterium]|nr:MAG: D-alanine--D-alanine ligase [Desulfobacteraceae bacterium]